MGEREYVGGGGERERDLFSLKILLTKLLESPFLNDIPALCYAVSCYEHPRALQLRPPVFI